MRKQIEKSFCSRISGIVLYSSIDFKSGCYIPVDQQAQWHEFFTILHLRNLPQIFGHVGSNRCPASSKA